MENTLETWKRGVGRPVIFASIGGQNLFAVHLRENVGKLLLEGRRFSPNHWLAWQIKLKLFVSLIKTVSSLKTEKLSTSPFWSKVDIKAI